MKRKRIIRILCFVLAASMLCLSLASCKKKGLLYATSDVGKLYEADVEDWIQYFLMSETPKTQEEIDSVTNKAIETAAVYMLYEKDLAEKGVVITKEAVDEQISFMKALFDTQYENGYESWKIAYNVTDEFLEKWVRSQLLSDAMKDYLFASYTPSEEEITNYYNGNSFSFRNEAGYTYERLLIEVINHIPSSVDWGEAKSAANAYIIRLRNGEDFSAVKAEVFEKYTPEKGYTVTAGYSGEGFIKKIDVMDIPNLEAKLAEYKSGFEEQNGTLNENAVEGTDEFTDYMIYLGKTSEFIFNYAIANELEEGEVYSQPVRCPFGYFILKLVDYTDETVFLSLEESRDTIVKILRQEAWNNNNSEIVEAYQKQMIDKYNLKLIRYTAATE